MDEPTQSYYRQRAAELLCCYAGGQPGAVDWLVQGLPLRAKVLDVGCGTGRDLKELLRRGYDAFGAEPCRELTTAATADLRAAGYRVEGRMLDASLPALEPFEDAEFDAVLCSAVLMHVPEESMFDAAYGLRRVVKPGGALVVSIPTERPEVDPVTRRDPDGRLFTDLPPAKLQLLFERIGFRLDDSVVTDDFLGRPGIRWAMFRFIRLDEQADRPLHLVESILNRDKKDATYKLALVRALADLAQTEHHLASFSADGTVKVPLAAIADKWLLYYWPLFASPTFICQKNGESPGSRKPVAIRKPIGVLIDRFGAGGLTAFHADWKGERLSAEVSAALKKARAKLRETIWNMPVRFAGGGDDFSVFQYDRADQTVCMPAGLWREFCLTGNWIHDATILRWAELTERLSKGEVKASQVLDHLLAMPDPDRRVGDARQCFDALSKKRCTWSEQRLLGNRFDVDHALPFSLWRNNDLWNLFPTASKVNGDKSDRLPTHDLLVARRDRIITCWQGLHERLDIRFAREAQTLLGRDEFRADNWESLLFTRFVEACEITATQRGAGRWQPADFTAAASPRAPRPQPGPVTYPRDEERLVAAGVREGSDERKVLPFPEIGNGAFTRFLPLVGSLAAGMPFHGFDAHGLGDPESLDWIEVPRTLAGRNRFVVRVAGDSMEPALNIGDLAVFEYHRRPRRDGQIVIANLPEFGMTESGVEAIKRIRQDEKSWIFESDNPAHEALVLAKAESEHPILGLFVGKL